MSNDNKAQKYWKENLVYLGILLAVWFLVSYVFGIFLVEPLNTIKIGGAKRVTSRGTKAGVLLFGSAGGGSGRNFPGATDWITSPWEAGAALAVLANRKRMAKMLRKVN